MAQITYIEFGNNKKHEIEVPSGQTVKDGAIDHSIPGIEAVCGGSCSCSTCHVYVDEAWVSKLREADSMETDVLEYASAVQKNSRLSCQITVTDELDGLIVTMPEEQNV